MRGVKAGVPERLSLGATFGMSMHMGMGYSMVNTVIEFEENRRIAWQATLAGFGGRFLGGRIWRYELEPVEGGTRVRESWDISQDHQRLLPPARQGGQGHHGQHRAVAGPLEELTAPAA